jgi:hypothetical protein
MTAISSPPSTLIYLFADRVVETIAPARWFLKGTRVPCKDVEVRTDRLACLLLASAFWTLREQGLIQLAVITKKRWIFDTVQVEVVPLNQAARSGLEQLLVDSITREGDSVAGVIRRAFAESVTDPWTDVVKEAVRDAIASGYVEDVGARSDVYNSGPAQGQRELRPKCGEIANLESQFEGFAALWERFRSSEPALYEQLLRNCENAVLSCREKYFV